MRLAPLLALGALGLLVFKFAFGAAGNADVSAEASYSPPLAPEPPASDAPQAATSAQAALLLPNVRAFLDMIGASEGAGYDTLYGGGSFASYADHPRLKVSAGGITSTAAGRYQFLARTWDDVAPRIGAPDFSPYWQDAAAVYLISRRGALDDVIAGRFADAVAKVSQEWASLPGAGYGQHENALASLAQVYVDAGGTIA
jgi:muramidase (phage lysozyme)